VDIGFGRRFNALASTLLLAAALLAPMGATARNTPQTLTEIGFDELPKEAREVLERIRTGGPFHYERDGVVFGNREKILPPEPRGYYHEYTVRTPGVKSRGARRIVCGGERTSPEACFYSDDHYRSFRRIRK
jgi:ribonuclease T1